MFSVQITQRWYHEHPIASRADAPIVRLVHFNDVRMIIGFMGYQPSLSILKLSTFHLMVSYLLIVISFIHYHMNGYNNNNFKI